MTALVKKIKNGRAYWYATESARVNGQKVTDPVYADEIARSIRFRLI